MLLEDYKLRCSPQKGTLKPVQIEGTGEESKITLQMLHYVSTAWLECFGWWWVNSHQCSVKHSPLIMSVSVKNGQQTNLCTDGSF